MDKQSEYWSVLQKHFFDEYGEESLSEIDQSSQASVFESDNRRILNIIFIIDVSGSMRGKRIAQVNYALEVIFKEMKTRDDLNSVIKVAIMEFDDSARWDMAQPIPLENYVFTPIEVGDSFTCYSSAYDALEKKLHSREFMNPDLGDYFSPLILFISDGEPVDVDDYPVALDKLRNNAWFAKSSKYAIAVGEDAKSPEIGKILSRFTGVIENVRYADEGIALCNLIEFIAIRASEVQTSMVSSSMDESKTKNSIFSDVDSNLFSSLYN